MALGDVHRVDDIVAENAGLGDWVERVTGVIGESWSHDRRARFIATSVNISVRHGGQRTTYCSSGSIQPDFKFEQMPALYSDVWQGVPSGMVLINWPSMD